MRHLTRTPNRLVEFAPDYAQLADTIHVIDMPQAADGRALHVLMNGDLE